MNQELNSLFKQGMVKRASRENARDRKASEDMSDNGDGRHPRKRQKYGLRSGSKPDPPPDSKDKKKGKGQQKDDLLWVNDDTLVLDDDSDDSDYVPPSQDSESQPVALNIHIHALAPVGANEEEEDAQSETDGFLAYLMDKYVNPTGGNEIAPEKPKRTRKSKELPIKLTGTEKTYYNSLTAKKKKEFLEHMKKVASLGFDDGEIPYKFRVLGLPIPDYVKSRVLKKIDTLTDMSMDSGESYKLRAWIDGFLRIPFGKTVPLPVKLEDGRQKCTEFMVDAKKQMSAAIYGMEPAKIQIMQIIAQWIVNPNSVGNVIALQGPMGVGKTSFAKNAIAKVLKRPFEFFSLGGASDISNFVGHSYTYEGSIWGRIAESLMHAGTMNPIFYFDEVDKISTTPHGEEITSMLIHLTDRSQNTEFHDRYFSGVDFDLSQCLFVFSLNDIDKVHPILRDRMTIINCEGYNEKDKKEILKGYVWPQIIERLRFAPGEVELSEEAMEYLIKEYSDSEKGVRTLIRTVETMMTRLNMLRIANDDTMREYKFYMDVEFPLRITEPIIQTLLGDLNKKEVETWRNMYS